MTQYMLSVHMGGPELSPEEQQKSFQDVDKVNADMQSAGAWVFAGGLHSADTATVVNAASGQIVTTDGPYTESKEQLGGFWIIEVADLDTALDWAKKATVACRGAVEVRPFQDNEG